MAGVLWGSRGRVRRARAGRGASAGQPGGGGACLPRTLPCPPPPPRPRAAHLCLATALRVVRLGLVSAARRAWQVTERGPSPSSAHAAPGTLKCRLPSELPSGPGPRPPAGRPAPPRHTASCLSALDAAAGGRAGRAALSPRTLAEVTLRGTRPAGRGAGCAVLSESCSRPRAFKTSVDPVPAQASTLRPAVEAPATFPDVPPNPGRAERPPWSSDGPTGGPGWRVVPHACPLLVNSSSPPPIGYSEWPPAGGTVKREGTSLQQEASTVRGRRRAGPSEVWRDSASEQRDSRGRGPGAPEL